MRFVKLGVWVAAFGIGFVFGPLLIRYLTSPPVLSGNASERPQHVAAPTPRPTIAAPETSPSSDGSHGRRLDGPGQTPDIRQQAASSQSSPDHTSPSLATHSRAHTTVASPPIPVHQTAILRASSTVPASGPDTVAPRADQPLSIVVTPTSGTPATVDPTQQAVWETPRFHVEVGQFTSQEEAQALVQRLQSLGYAATSSDKSDAYRVWVGGYFDRETAERLAASLRKAGFVVVLVP
jgi:cell division septation protein DedD